MYLVDEVPFQEDPLNDLSTSEDDKLSTPARIVVEEIPDDPLLSISSYWNALRKDGEAVIPPPQEVDVMVPIQVCGIQFCVNSLLSSLNPILNILSNHFFSSLT